MVAHRVALRRERRWMQTAARESSLRLAVARRGEGDRDGKPVMPARPPLLNDRTEDGKTIAAPAAFCSPAVGWEGNEMRERPVCLSVGR